MSVKKLLLFISPFGLWLLFFAKTPPHSDSFEYYHWIKYFLDGMAQGEFPLWNPFFAWGSQDDFDMRFVGEYNPFLYLITLFNLLGFSFAVSFNIYMALYFFIGLIGFYLLAREIFEDEMWAYVAYLLLMFSSLGVIAYWQLVILFIFVPSVWFFYFLTRFLKTGNRLALVGLTFTCMILATTYMPFHFLTIFFLITITFLLINFLQLKAVFTPALQSLKKSKWLMAVCLASLALSFIPGINWYKAASDNQYVLITDHRASSSEGGHVAHVDIESINLSGIASEMTFRELISDHDLGHSRFFNIPVFCFIIIFMSVLNPWNKRLGVLFFSQILILMVALADVMPVHEFLYKHIYFFKLFRNYFLFLPLLMPLVILFCTEQLRLLLQHQNKKAVFIVLTVIIHCIFEMILQQEEFVSTTSHVTVILSGLFFVLYFSGFLKGRTKVVFGCLIFLVLSQPLETFYYYLKDIGKAPLIHLGEHWKPEFSFVRPEKEPAKGGYYGYRGSHKTMEESSGFFHQRYFGVRHSYDLHRKAGHDALKDYVKYKFWVYDRVQYLDEGQFDMDQFEKNIKRSQNLAYVFDDHREHAKVSSDAKAQPVEGNSDRFEVLGFGLNYITFKTNYPTKKFVVYNDSFHKGWQALVNGQRAGILRSNFAFKGLWLDPGEQIVHMRFGSSWKEWGYLLLIAYFFIYFFSLCILAYKKIC